MDIYLMRLGNAGWSISTFMDVDGACIARASKKCKDGKRHSVFAVSEIDVDEAIERVYRKMQEDPFYSKEI